MKKTHFNSRYKIFFIDKDFLLKKLLYIWIKPIPTKLDIKSSDKKGNNKFKFAIILIHISGKIRKIILIKREIDFIYSLLVNVLFNSDTIELEDIFLYYGRNTRTIHFYKSIEVLNITIFNF